MGVFFLFCNSSVGPSVSPSLPPDIRNLEILVIVDVLLSAFQLSRSAVSFPSLVSLSFEEADAEHTERTTSEAREKEEKDFLLLPVGLKRLQEKRETDKDTRVAVMVVVDIRREAGREREAEVYYSLHICQSLPLPLRSSFTAPVRGLLSVFVSSFLLF